MMLVADLRELAYPVTLAAKGSVAVSTRVDLMTVNTVPNKLPASSYATNE
jgi:hypothetical protein